MIEFDKSVLETWRDRLTGRIEELQTERAAIDSELQVLRKKLDLTRQMLGVDQTLMAAAAPEANGSRPTSISIKENVRAILSSLDRPLHISEIHKEFIGRGYPIPGEGTAFNILAHIVKDKSFARVARGTYALIENVPPEQRLTATRKKSRRRRLRRSVVTNG